MYTLVGRVIFTVMFCFATATQASTGNPESKCESAAESVIRKTLATMVPESELKFKIDEMKEIGKSYGGARILRFESKMIIAPDGFYAGAGAEVTLVENTDQCIISKVTVDLNVTQPE